MKFVEDLSNLRAEKSGYYKSYVHEFVSTYFSRERLEGTTLLDFGCGPGFYSALLARRGAYVTGIDMECSF